ncbi:MAG TPA: MFS transporter [Solirubrobacteraceae bacterium]|nr:MFS transporter [Solirubrobacteraceae bacterium]
MRALVGILAAALTLRTGILVVGPVIEDIRAETGMSSAAAGLLGTIPFLCMGVFAFAGVPLVRRLGNHRVVALGLGLIAAGGLLRAAMPTGALLIVATVPLGMGIAVAGLALPGVVNEHFPRRAGAITGAYVAALSVGGAAAALATVPLADALGSWRWAFAVVAVPTLAALPVWLLTPARKHHTAPPPVWTRRPGRRPPRLGLVLAGIFGFQSMCFAAMVSWVAAVYTDAGWSEQAASAATAAIPLTTIPAALVIPALSDGRDRRWSIVGSGIVMTVGMMGLAFAPLAAPWVWLVAFSVGAGALFPLSLTLPIDLRDDAVAVTQLTAWMLGLGYFLSALGPVIVGALRDLTGGFTAAIAVVGALGALSGVLGLAPDLRPDRRSPPRAEGVPDAPIA